MRNIGIQLTYQIEFTANRNNTLYFYHFYIV